MNDEERLTKRDGKGRAYFDDDGSLIRGASGSFRQKKDMTAQFIHQRLVALDKTIDRLAAYEDTGLEPEEINERLLKVAILEEIKTCDLVAELSKREGVETHIAEPYQDVAVLVNGPAMVLVVID